jgi:DNA-binding transcriptional LysR family regulator
MRGTRFAALSAFAAVADHGSFTKAASQLGVSTGSISQTVRDLEDDLGVRLLNRTTRSVAPTEAGEAALARLRPLLDEFEAVIETIGAFRDRPSGRLRLTVPPPVATAVLAPLLPRFLARYPDVVVDVSVDSKLTDIVADHFDAGVRPGGLVARDMIAVRITGTIRLCVVASADYLVRHSRPKTPDDLRRHTCIRLRYSSGTLQPWRFVVGGETIEVAADGPLIVNDPNLLIQAALDGVGLAYVPESLIETHLASGQLVPVLADSMVPPFDGFYLYYPSKRQNLASLRALIAFLQDAMKAGESRGPRLLPPAGDATAIEAFDGFNTGMRPQAEL